MTHISQSSIKIPSNSKKSTNIQNTAPLNKISLGDSPFFWKPFTKKHNQKNMWFYVCSVSPPKTLHPPSPKRKHANPESQKRNETKRTYTSPLEAGAELFELEQFRDTSSDARSGGLKRDFYRSRKRGKRAGWVVGGLGWVEDERDRLVWWWYRIWFNISMVVSGSPKMW